MIAIRFKSGYKYQLTADYSIAVPAALYPVEDVSNRFIKLTLDGLLTVREDYAWNGANGPTADTPDTMRGSLVHDALYQLMRGRHLDYLTQRDAADKLLCFICVEDGMKPLRAAAWYQAVRLFGEPNAMPEDLIPPIAGFVIDPAMAE